MSDRPPSLEVEKYLNCYLRLQNAIIKQRMLILRDEFVHVGFSFYLAVFVKLVSETMFAGAKSESLSKRIKQVSLKLEERRADFKHLKSYRGDLNYLFSLYRKELNKDIWNKDPEVKRIFKKKEVVLSRFGYETFNTLLSNKNFNLLRKAISEGIFFVTAADSQKKEAYVGCEVSNRGLSLLEIDHVNQSNYITGMSRDLFNFVSKLEDIFQKKQTHLVDKLKKDVVVFPREQLFDPKAKFPIEKSSDTFLSNCPEYKNKYLVDFGKAYLNRRVVDRDHDPSILRLDLGDSDFKVSVVETNVTFKVLLLGYMSGKVRVLLLYKVFVWV